MPEGEPVSGEEYAEYWGDDKIWPFRRFYRENEWDIKIYDDGLMTTDDVDTSIDTLASDILSMIGAFKYVTELRARLETNK